MERAAQTEPGARPGLFLTFALRELRGGLSGFYIFLACIGLGVGAITGVNAVASAITQGIAERGQSILGGDLAVSITQRELDNEVVDYLDARGTMSRAVTMRAMARMPDGSDQALVELKAVDGAYPLYGSLKSGEDPLNAAVLTTDQAWVEPILLERLQLSPGDRIAIGNGEFTIAGPVTEEPDRLSEGVGFGPRVMIGMEGLDSTGLVRTGSLYRSNFAVRLDDPSENGLRQTLETLRERFPGAPFRVRSRENAAPALTRNIERFSQFLTLVGLAALIVGGVGVANSVRAYLDTKRDVIATLKSLGASGGFIFRMYLAQIMVLALIGVAIGLALGLSTPPIARVMLVGIVPLAESTGLHVGRPVLLGTVYGLLTAFIFAVWPLAIARDVKAASLFRSSGYQGRGLPGPVYLILLVAGVAILAWMAIAFSGNRQIAAIFLAAVAFSFVVLRIVSSLIQKLAARLPAIRRTSLRMAVGNIHRPGSATPSVVLSLGLGLALITALALIDSSLREQVSANIPEQAPAFFFVDVQNNEIEAFEDKISSLAPDGQLNAVPMLRGRVTRLKGIAAEDYVTREGQWVLRGDRGITYSKAKPDNATLAGGQWWPADYSGEPLVSFAAEEAEELGLVVGDIIEVNVLGRTISAKIANLRNVEWQTLSINFVMVFSPNTFAGAPHGWLATLTLPQTDVVVDEAQSRDGRILREITADFPTITSVRVRDAIDTVNALIAQLSNAIRVASTVALAASFLVLAGALAAGNHVRAHDAVIMKTLGAQRPFLIGTMITEFTLLGFVTAVFGLAAGGVAAWYVVTQIMEFPAVFDPLIALSVVVAALAATIVLGLAGTWQILGRKPAPALRET